MWKRITYGVAIVFGALLATVLGEETWLSVRLLREGQPLPVAVVRCDCDGPRLGRQRHCELDPGAGVRWQPGTFKWSAHRHCREPSCQRWTACAVPPRFGCPTPGQRITAYWIPGDVSTLRLQRVAWGSWLLSLAAVLMGLTVLRVWLRRRR